MRRKLLKIFLITVVVTIGIAVGSTLGVALLSNWLGSRAGEPTTQRQVTPKVPTYSREELLDETNKHRERPLTLDPVLNETAQAKCDDLAARDEFTHGEGDVERYRDRAGRSVFGENLAHGYLSAKEVVDAWIASPTHKAVLVGEKYRNVGYGICSFRDGLLTVQHVSD